MNGIDLNAFDNYLMLYYNDLDIFSYNDLQVFQTIYKIQKEVVDM